MSGNEETLGKFSAQMIIVILKAPGDVGPDRMYYVRRDRSKQQLWERLLSEAYRLSSISVNQNTVPTNVYCSRVVRVNAITR